MKNNKKLTRHQKNLLFYDFLQEGKTLKYYAEQFGVSIDTVGKVIERKLKKGVLSTPPKQ